MPSLEADGGMNVRQRRAPAASARRQQTSMLHQINAHERREKQQLKLIQSHQDVLFAGMLQSYCKVLAFLLVLGIVLVLYFQPSQLLSLWRRSSERLPSRRIATLYPAELNVLEALPRFFLGYGTYMHAHTRTVSLMIETTTATTFTHPQHLLSF